MVLFSTVAFLIAYGVVWHMGRAHADAPQVDSATTIATADPGSVVVQLYDFMRTGKGTAAAGVVFMLITWALRNSLGSKWKFWKTPIGGYLLGFGLPVLSYFDLALEGGSEITISLVFNAIGAGWVAAGGWEHLRDAIEAMRKPGSAAPAAGASILIVLLVFAGSTLQACKNTQTSTTVKQDAVDCTKGELGKLETIAILDAPAVVNGSITWDDAETQSVALGVDAGGCFLSHLKDQVFKSATAPSGSAAPTRFESQVSDADRAMTKFRADTKTTRLFVTAAGVH
jgi:hypothetical protein